MDPRIREAVAGEEAYVVGGAVRDELLGRPVVDVDVACRAPERAARAYREVAGGAVFLLSERHGAWRVALPGGRTVDFTELRGSVGDDLAGRDFTVNAIAVPVAGGDAVDPFDGRRDLAARLLRKVSDRIVADDPLRLLRAVRLEDELGLVLEAETEGLVRRSAGRAAEPAGERVLAELVRLSPQGYVRLAELGLLAALGGRQDGLRSRLERVAGRRSPQLLLVAALGEAVFRLPLSNEARRLARTVLSAHEPSDAAPRAIHRFRRATEPFAVDAALFLGRPDLVGPIEESRAAEPPEPLVRGDELGLPPGPAVGRLLERIAEELAAGTIASRQEALELVRRERS